MRPSRRWLIVKELCTQPRDYIGCWVAMSGTFLSILLACLAACHVLPDYTIVIVPLLVTVLGGFVNLPSELRSLGAHATLELSKLLEANSERLRPRLAALDYRDQLPPSLMPLEQLRAQRALLDGDDEGLALLDHCLECRKVLRR